MKKSISFHLTLLILIIAYLNVASANTNDKLIGLYDIQGRFAGLLNSEEYPVESRAVVLPPGMSVIADGEIHNLASGIYFRTPVADYGIFGDMILDQFEFVDVTEEYLPLEEWNASCVKVGDLNEDGLEDIVFIRHSSTDIGDRDYRPRVWMQTPEGNFVDESETRMPAVSTPSYDFELIDIDSDGDLDLFSCGYMSFYQIHAALFINDGTGHFTDESNDRLPHLSGISFAYFSDFADFNNDGSVDLIVIVLQYPEPPDYEMLTPVLWMNYSSGYFLADTLGRLPANTGYGFFIPLAADIDNDGNTDILFANIEYTIFDENGIPVKEFSGQNACFLNTGNGFFVNETDERMPEPDCVNTRDIAASDVDDDGDIDIAEIGMFFDQFNEQNRILLNDGFGYYSVLPEAFPENLEGWFNDVEFGLLNDDDFPDIFMVKVMPGVPDYDALLVNMGDGTLSDSSQLLPEVLDFGTSCALFDHEHDADVDIFSTNIMGDNPGDSAGQNVFYHNLLYDVTEIDDPITSIPLRFSLSQNHPNPFNAATTISYTLPEQGEVAISIYNLLGQRVAIIFEGTREAGEHTITWDADDHPSGVYFARLETGERTENIKMVLLK